VSIHIPYTTTSEQIGSDSAAPMECDIVNLASPSSDELSIADFESMENSIEGNDFSQPMDSTPTSSSKKTQPSSTIAESEKKKRGRQKNPPKDTESTEETEDESNENLLPADPRKVADKRLTKIGKQTTAKSVFEDSLRQRREATQDMVAVKREQLKFQHEQASASSLLDREKFEFEQTKYYRSIDLEKQKLEMNERIRMRELEIRQEEIKLEQAKLNINK
jgi:hypothetical protein